MNSLAMLKCEACRVGAPPASREEIEAFLHEHPMWTVETADGIPQLVRLFQFPNFASAMAFAVRVGELAEREGHHPALLVEWGKVTVRWWTHKIRNLHRNDLIMAAKTDALMTAEPSSPAS